MDQLLVRKYLRFLVETSEGLIKKDILESYDIASLQRELRLFQDKFGHGSLGGGPIEDSILALRVKANEADLEGGKLGPLKFMMKIAFGRGLLGQELERKRQAAAKRAIEDFRNEVSHILFALEI